MITVFVGTTDRTTTLERTLASYRRMRGEHEIVIVDNGTTDPAAQQLLATLEGQRLVKQVYRLPACDSLYEVADNFNLAIRDQYDSGDAGEWFAVTDADICFDGTNAGALGVYVQLARELGCAVGPHLRVDRNIPAGYPLRSRVLACETWMLYRDTMQVTHGIPWSKTQIDTTFHLFPATRRFNRLHMDPVRVGPPYDAMHLDWHLDVFNPTPESSVYIAGRRQVGSWGKAWIRAFWFAFQKSPELAFERLMEEPRTHRDLCNTSFMASWCYQYGHGVEASRKLSERWLYAAIPRSGTEHYWQFEPGWHAMIYDNDFSALGWNR